MSVAKTYRVVSITASVADAWQKNPHLVLLFVFLIAIASTARAIAGTPEVWGATQGSLMSRYDFDGNLLGTFSTGLPGGFNNVDLLVIPEPSSFFLFATSLFTLIVFNWR